MVDSPFLASFQKSFWEPSMMMSFQLMARYLLPRFLNPRRKQLEE